MKAKIIILLLGIIVSVTTNAKMPPVHDPVIAKGEDGRYYMFSTGMGINVMSSDDLNAWKKEQPVFDVMTGIPLWAKDSVPGYRGHTWAPDISYHNGKWLLYYSCSTFGKNNSAIGLATNNTLDPLSPKYKWEDRGMVVKSHKHRDNWNAIDPNLYVTDKNLRVLVFGSFWDGIQMIKLDSDYKTPISTPKTIARRINKRSSLSEIDKEEYITIEGNDTIEAGDNAIEAPFIVKHKGFYYLFVSFDYCCRGQASTYKTVYGRSKDIEGPYYDKEGKLMLKGGGTLLVGPNADYFGVGHCAVYKFGKKWYFFSHAYDKARNGEARLFIKELQFDKKGWIKQ